MVCPKEEAQKSPTITTVDSLEQAPEGMLALEDSDLDALKEASVTLENRALIEGSPNTDHFLGETLSKVAADRTFLARLAMAGPRRARMVDMMVLSSYVQLMEWAHPSVDTVVPGPMAA